jgi:pimeloyl-ACP methyl ester carboxylesterase
MTSRPNIVMVHGAWMDGSCWRSVTQGLQARGFHVRAPQFPFTSITRDLARLRQVVQLQTGPTVLVGHCYGGQIITALEAATHEVAGLVYVTGFALDEGESLADLMGRGPATPALEHMLTDEQGFAWLSEIDYVQHLVGDVHPDTARALWASQQPLAVSAFADVMGVPGWKSLPCWYLVATKDEALPARVQRHWATRMRATTADVAAGHVPAVSHPDEVTDFIASAVESL